MGRKKKKKKQPEGEATAPKVPEHISRPFADALGGLKAQVTEEARAAQKAKDAQAAEAAKEKLAAEAAKARMDEAARSTGDPAVGDTPTPKYDYEDRVAFNVAYADVAPLGAKKTGKKHDKKKAARVVRVPPSDLADSAARARLASLVGDGLHFDVRREDGWVEGCRQDAPKGRLADLRNGRASADAELDLHGMTGDEAEDALMTFLKRERSRGRTIVRVIHGKGLHSSGGVGVLGARVVEAITDGPAASLVHAFVTSGVGSGGSGALLVRLETR